MALGFCMLREEKKCYHLATEKKDEKKVGKERIIFHPIEQAQTSTFSDAFRELLKDPLLMVQQN